MNLSIPLMSLSLVLMIGTSEAIEQKDKDETIAILKQTSVLLKEERIRWKCIHNSPSKDEAILTEYPDSFKVNIKIDPVVRNMINSQPITREYIITKNPPPERGMIYEAFVNSGIYLTAAASAKYGISPGLAAGYNPPIFRYGGLGFMVTKESIGISIYADLGIWNMKHVIIGISPGIGPDGYCINFMTGVRI